MTRSVVDTVNLTCLCQHALLAQHRKQSFYKPQRLSNHQSVRPGQTCRMVYPLVWILPDHETYTNLQILVQVDDNSAQKIFSLAVYT